MKKIIINTIFHLIATGLIYLACVLLGIGIGESFIFALILSGIGRIDNTLTALKDRSPMVFNLAGEDVQRMIDDA